MIVLLISMHMTKLTLALLAAWFVFLMAISGFNENAQAEVPDLLEPKQCNIVKPKPIKVAFVEPEQTKEKPKPEKVNKKKSSVNKSGSNNSNAGIGKRIDATYSDPDRVINWLMAHGARLLVLDAAGKPLAELDQNFLPIAPSPFSESGSWRSVDREVRLLNYGEIPEDGAHVHLFWPNRLWGKVIGLSKKYRGASLKLRYSILDEHLVITPLKILTVDGKWLKNLQPITL